MLKYAALTLLIAIAAVNSFNFAQADQWIRLLIVGLALPAAAIIGWKHLRRHTTPSVVADHMLVFAVIATLAFLLP